MANIVNRVIAEDGSSTLAMADDGFLNAALKVCMSPLSIFSGAPTVGTQVFISEQTVGYAVLGAIAGGIVIGDRFGDSIPVLGGRR